VVQMVQSPLAVHADINVRVAAIGREQQPIILVENFLADPEQLVDYAVAQESARRVKGMYPGLRVDTPRAYMALIQASLGEIIYHTFQMGPQDVAEVESYLSIVTTPPEQLHPFQRIPHFDGTNPKDIAFLHYLCDERHGGTSFYRHRSSGNEYVNQARYERYIKTLNAEVLASGLTEPAQYMNGDTPLFERIASVAASFNRLIIYRGTSLHSGDISGDYGFDASSRTGRLTITSFLYGQE
jgi:hypothetical protein